MEERAPSTDEDAGGRRGGSAVQASSGSAGSYAGKSRDRQSKKRNTYMIKKGTPEKTKNKNLRRVIGALDLVPRKHTHTHTHIIATTKY